MLNREITNGQWIQSSFFANESPKLVEDKTKTVLLVENQPDETELIELALDSIALSCQLVVVPDGKQALNYLLNEDKSPNSWPALMLMKGNLPKLRGIEVLQQLRSHPKTRYLPVVVFSSCAEVATIEQSYHWGCNSYFHKPIDFEKYRTLLSQLITYWLQCNETPYQYHYGSNESLFKSSNC